MAFVIVNADSQTVLTAATPLSYSSGVYYFKRCKVDSPIRKITIDSSPGPGGGFAQDFGDFSWPISGGSLLIRQTSEATCKSVFEALAADIKHQIGLTLTIPNESGSSGGTYPYAVCTAFELMRRGDGRIVVPDGNGSTYRAYVQMEFLQLA